MKVQAINRPYRGRAVGQPFDVSAKDARVLVALGRVELARIDPDPYAAAVTIPDDPAPTAPASPATETRSMQAEEAEESESAGSDASETPKRTKRKYKYKRRDMQAEG